MRKLKFYVSALLMAGMLSTAVSCVDDKESDSVSKIREAQAGKIKGEAELKAAETAMQIIENQIKTTQMADQALILKAQAQAAEANAAKAKAESDMAVATAKLAEANGQILKEKAQAEADKAKADLIIAEIARKEAQTKANQAESDYLVTIERNKILIEKAKNDVLREQAKYKKEIEDAKIKATQENDEIYSGLLSDYGDELGEVATLKESISANTVNKVKKEDSKIKGENVTSYEQVIKNTEAANVQLLAGIETSKKDIEDFKKDLADIQTSVAAAKAKLISKKEEAKTLETVVANAKADYNQKNTIWSDLNSEYNQFNNNVNGRSLEQIKNQIVLTNKDVARQTKTIADSIAALDKIRAAITTTFNDWQKKADSIPTFTVTVAGYKTAAEIAQKKYNDALLVPTTPPATLALLQKQAFTADSLHVESTIKLTRITNEVPNLENKYRQVEFSNRTLENDIRILEQILGWAKIGLENLKNSEALFKGDPNRLIVLTQERELARNNESIANNVWNKASSDLNIVNNMISNLEWDIRNSGGSIDGFQGSENSFIAAIKNAENSITDNLATIEKNKVLIEGSKLDMASAIKNFNTTTDAEIARLQVLIDKDTQLLKLWEAKVDITKKRIEAHKPI